jgi:hypothetical protein
MASFIFVWEQNMYLQKEIAGHEWPGHSSMNIGNHFDGAQTFTPTRGLSPAAGLAELDTWRKNNLTRNYVSYWPATRGATFGLADILGKRDAGKPKYSIADDINAEGYLPDWVIKLNTDATKEQDMLAEWATIRDKPNSTYGAFKKNCSTIVSRVLHAGGFYAKKWAVNCNWVWAPGDVRRLALKVGGVPLKWSDFASILAAAGIPPSKYLSRDYTRDAAYSNIGVPSKYYWGTKVSGVAGNP